MQTTIRNLPVPVTEAVRIAPSHPVGEERHAHRHAPPYTADDRRDEKDAASALADRPGPLQWDVARPPRPAPPETGGDPADHRFGGRAFTRLDLLSSASFQAQHLGQVPPYEHEALLRATATGAYRQASGLSVTYMSAFQPVDIRV